MKTVIWLPGLFANAGGEKVDAVRDSVLAQGAAFLPFDYPNWDKPADFRVSEAIDAVKALVANLKGEVVFAASSFGTWVAIKVAEAFPDKVVGIVAAAPRVDFVQPIYRRLPLWKRLAVRVLGAPYRVGDRKHTLSWGFIRDAMRPEVAVWRTDVLQRLATPIDVLVPTRDKVWGCGLMQDVIDCARNCRAYAVDDDHSLADSQPTWRSMVQARC